MEPFTLVVPVDRTDRVLGPETARVVVNEHIEGGRQSGVRATPAFFVDGAIVDVSFGLQHLFEAVKTRL